MEAEGGSWVNSQLVIRFPFPIYSLIRSSYGNILQPASMSVGLVNKAFHPDPVQGPSEGYQIGVEETGGSVDTRRYYSPQYCGVPSVFHRAGGGSSGDSGWFSSGRGYGELSMSRLWGDGWFVDVVGHRRGCG